MGRVINQVNFGRYLLNFYEDGNIICTCMWGSIHPDNYINGLQVCKHIKNYIKYGKKTDKKGYVLIYKPDHKYSKPKKGWISEHRAVVEDFIERRLRKGWCIHHIDEDKQNNKIENLMIFRSHKAHSAFHNKVRQFGFTNPIKRQIGNKWEKFKKV